MNVLAAVCETAALGEADAMPGDDAGALDDADGVTGAAEEAGVATVVAVLDAGDAAELPDELQAVTNTAAHPSAAQAATCLARFEFVVHMMSNPLTPLAAQRAMSPLRRPPRRRGCGPLFRRRHHGPFGTNITAGGGTGLQGTERTPGDQPKHWPSPR